MHPEPMCIILPENPGHVGDSQAWLGWDRGPTVGLGPPSRPQSAAQGPSPGGRDVAHVAMAASDMLLLDAESGPLRVYVEELKPTPEGDLEILLQKWWASPPKHGTPTPQGYGPPQGGVQEGPGPQGRGTGLGVSWYPWRSTEGCLSRAFSFFFFQLLLI